MQNTMPPLCGPFDFPGGEHGVLLIHGFTGCPGHMRKIGDTLAAQGFGARAILLPGHGTQPDDMRKVTWQDWLLASRQAAREMREKYRYFSVVGHSMGGVLALILAEEMDLTACVSIAAPMRTVNKLRPLALPVSLVYPTMHKRIDSPERDTLDQDYDFTYTSYPTRSTHDLSVLMSRAKQHLDLIRCPLLAVQSHADRTVTADSPEIILNGIRSEKKAMLWVEKAPHVCTIAPEWPKIAEGTAAFLREAEKQG